MRTFVVLVGRRGSTPMGYPECGGEDALKTMETLRGRGVATTALTRSKYGDEELCIDEMRELYGEEEMCVAARVRADSLSAKRGGQLALDL